MPQYQHVVQTLGPDRPHPAFCNGVGFRRPNRCSNLLYIQRPNSAVEDYPKATVSVMDKVTRGNSIRTACLSHLLRQPLARRMSGYSSMHDLSGTVINYEVDVQRPEPDSLNREKVARPELLSVLCQKSPPAW